MTLRFNVKKISIEIKNHKPIQVIKSIYYEEKLTQYKVLPNSSLHILLELLDQHLPTSTSHIFLLKYT